MPERTFDFFSYEDTIFADIEADFNLVIDLAIYADILYRVVKSLLLVNKYWNLSAIGKPPGDARVEEISGKNWGLKASPEQKLAAIVTHPLVLNIVSAVFISLLTAFFWFFYGGFYDEFTDGCVVHDHTEIPTVSNGTMIFRNMYSLSFGFAVREGDTIQTSNVDRLNVEREVNCEQEFQISSEDFRNQVDLFVAILNDYLVTQAFREEVVTCLDLSGIDSSGGTSLEAIMNNEVFLQNLTVPEDAVYNCTSIPQCEVECNDPNDNLFGQEVHAAACSTELWIHATFLGVILIAFTFISLQIFRIEFLKAVVRLWWRNLNPYDFAFLGSCTRDGQHIDPEQVTQDGDTFQDTVADALHKAIRNWEKFGIVNLAYAFSLNIPWIAAAVILPAGLEYDFE